MVSEDKNRSLSKESLSKEEAREKIKEGTIEFQEEGFTNDSKEENNQEKEESHNDIKGGIIKENKDTQGEENNEEKEESHNDVKDDIDNENKDIQGEENTNDANSCNSSTNQNSNSQNVVELKFKFRNDIRNIKLRDCIMNSYKKNRTNPNLPEVIEAIKKELDETFSKGWIVFGGNHMVGVCSYIENTLADFEVEGTSFVIFQTIYPAD